jgi:diaminohydroxyphosphoribosylaminopyrimidine deaminase / 5-amino-6-(5-phosphoribosylamino)uracil reductase
MFSSADNLFMAQALRLAEQGLYSTTPNPRVGCVIVKDGHVIGEGAHLKAGEPHAEVHALRQAQAQHPHKIAGSEVYVTLEPCSHFGRTPPCADALVAAGVARVVAAMQDPNPQVAGQGLARLAAHGITVAHGLMQTQAMALNAGFILRMTRGRPWLRSKLAASLDGRTALSNGVSQWITGEAARQDVQRWRAQSCAILTGIGTVLADDPAMSVRLSTDARQPLKVLVDSQLRIPPQARLLQGGPVLIAHAMSGSALPSVHCAALQAAGAELIALPDAVGRVNLKSLLEMLAQRGINEVFVEAGAELHGALLAQQLVDELLFYYAPSIMGSQAQAMFQLPDFSQMQQAIALDLLDVRQVGRDVRMRLKPQYSV